MSARLAHRDAIKATLEGVGLRVHVAGVTEDLPAYGYVVLALSLDFDGDALCDTRDVSVSPFTVTSVGGSEDQCAKTASLVEDTLEGLRLTVEGRRCWRIHKVSSLPIRLDEDVPDRATFVGTDTYTLRSTLA